MYESPREPPSPPHGEAPRVLVVAGDPEITEVLLTSMKLAGYHAAAARTGAEGVLRATRHHCDLVVLDATRPGFEDVPRGRRLAPAGRPPMLYLTTCDLVDRLAPELRPGAEDYVIKPLRIAEVLARAHALLRGRKPRWHDGMRTYQDLVLDDAAYQAWRGPRPLGLTPAEYRLLRHLLANAGRVLSKEQISRHVWGEIRAQQAIEKLVSRLRHKVDRDGPALIHTRRGFGYCFGGLTKSP